MSSTGERPSGDAFSGQRWPSSPRAMSLGLMMPIGEQSAFGGTPRFADIVAVAEAARDAGIEIVWFADHFAVGGGTADDPYRGVWEAIALMAGVAARVPDVQIGALVANTGYRNPGVIARAAETIDEISDGRFILGLGAGGMKPDHDQFGFPFDRRASRFEDAIAIIHALLRDGEVDYRGEFFTANRAVNRPRGPRPDGPPIVVGTTGHRMLRLTARYADAWNTTWYRDPTEVAAEMRRVDEACTEVGRDPRTLVRTAGGNLAMPGYHGARPNAVDGTVEEKAAWLDGFRAIGLDHFVIGLDPATPESLAAFAEVVRAYDAMA